MPRLAVSFSLVVALAGLSACCLPRPRRRPSLTQQTRSSGWCPLQPAARRTSLPACWPSASRRRWARPWWLRTGRAAAVWWARQRPCAPRPTATASAGHGVHHGNNPAINPKIPYNPLTDFTPIINMAAAQRDCRAPQLPGARLRGLCGRAQKNPGYSYSSSGTGGIGHLQMELYKACRRLRVAHPLPSRRGLALTDTVAGQVSIILITCPRRCPYQGWPSDPLRRGCARVACSCLMCPPSRGSGLSPSTAWPLWRAGSQGLEQRSGTRSTAPWRQTPPCPEVKKAHRGNGLHHRGLTRPNSSRPRSRRSSMSKESRRGRKSLARLIPAATRAGRSSSRSG